MSRRDGRWSQPLVEAGIALLAASLLIRLASFASIARIAEKSDSPGRPGRPREIAVICRALAAWSRRLPWPTLCFEQGLAAHWLLRRRGLASTLFYGAARVDGELKAHVWVRSGERDVIGCDNASHYALLASFPAAHSSLSVKPVNDKHSS